MLKRNTANGEATVPLLCIANVTSAINCVQLTSTGTLEITTVLQALKSCTENKGASRQNLQMLFENINKYIKKKIIFASIGSYFVVMIHDHLFPSVELNAVSHKAAHTVLLKIQFENLIYIGICGGLWKFFPDLDTSI